MDHSLIFLYSIFFISIIVYAIAGLIQVALVIPLQYKESKVDNGLKVLREQMLMKGKISFGVIVLSIFALTVRFFILDTNILRYIITTMIFSHALCLFSLSYLDYRIYHQQYSDENKRIHTLIEQEEKRQHNQGKKELTKAKS